jgi:hypothetical protein
MSSEPRSRRFERLRRQLELRPRDSQVTMSNLVQAGVTVLVAVALALAALIAGSAGGKWHAAVTDQTKWSAAVIEDLRHVYLDEAPPALEFGLATVRAEEFDRGDAETEREALFAFKSTGTGNDLIEGSYELPGGGYEVGRRLADVRAQNRNLVELDPEATFSAGDRRNRVAILLLLATVPLVLAFVAVDLVLRRHRPPSPSHPHGESDGGLVPRPWANTDARLWTSVALGAWLIVALLPAAQTHFGGKAQRESARAAITASQVTTMLHASGLVEGFTAAARQRVGWVTITPLARQAAAMDTTDPAEARRLMARAQAEQRVAGRAEAVAEAMTRPPSTRAGVDAATVTVANAGIGQAEARLTEQHAAVDSEERAGSQNQRVGAAILFAGLATSLSALAAAQRHRRMSLNLATAGVLALALLALATLPLA